MQISQPLFSGLRPMPSMGQNRIQQAPPLVNHAVPDALTVRFGNATPVTSTPTPPLNPLEEKAKAFVDLHGQKLYELGLASSKAGWEFYSKGGEEGRMAKVEETQLAVLNYTKDPALFKAVDDLHKVAGEIRDPLLKRQVELLHRTFLKGNMSPQIQEALITKGTAVEDLYNGFRVTVGGEKLSDQKLKGLFKESNDSETVKTYWTAKHAVGNYRGETGGASVAERIIELANLRNQMAKENGYSDYYNMSLAHEDIEESQLLEVMAAVKAGTDAPYTALMAKLDKAAIKRFGLKGSQREQVRLPWYQGNSANGSDLMGSNLERTFQFKPDQYLTGKDLVAMVEKAANLMGNSVQWILDRSSLYYEPDNKGKSQHWYLFPIDTDDVRVLANLDKEHKSNMAFGLSTMYHETLGHGLDFAQVNKNLPPTLRGLHTITTEANAMLHEDIMASEKMLKDVVGLSARESKQVAKAAKIFRAAEKLAVTRSMLAIIDFERSMYKKLAENPHTSQQELNNLWWQKQAEYLQLKRPEGRENESDWARVPHYAGAPVYYQDYLLADVQRAQELAYINKLTLPEDPGNSDCLLTPEAGGYLKKYRTQGLTHKWDKIVEDMTGEKLNPAAQATEFKVLDIPLASTFSLKRLAHSAQQTLQWLISWLD